MKIAYRNTVIGLSSSPALLNWISVTFTNPINGPTDKSTVPRPEIADAISA